MSSKENKRTPEAQERYNNDTVSATGLSAFSRSPLAFREYKDKEDATESEALIIGKAVHCRLLEPDTYDDRYYVMDTEAPGGNMGTFIDRYFWYVSNEFAPEMAKDLAYKDSGYKTKFETVWKNFEEKPECVAYWNALNEAKGKTILTSKDEFVIENCVESVYKHKSAEYLLKEEPEDGVEFHNELELLWKMKEFDFNMKSILDRVKIDTVNKLINITDIKTTSKSVHNFRHSYKNFAYYRQLAFYGHAVMWYVREVLKEDPEDWALTSALIVVQTNGQFETAVYAPHPKDMEKGHIEIIELLTKLSWHYDTNNWNYPIEYYLGGGIMPIALEEYETHDINGETGQGSSSRNKND